MWLWSMSINYIYEMRTCHVSQKNQHVLICVTLLFYSAVNGNMNIFPYVSNLESAIYIDLLTCHTKMVENDFETPEKA